MKGVPSSILVIVDTSKEFFTSNGGRTDSLQVEYKQLNDSILTMP